MNPRTAARFTPARIGPREVPAGSGAGSPCTGGVLRNAPLAHVAAGLAAAGLSTLTPGIAVAAAMPADDTEREPSLTHDGTGHRIGEQAPAHSPFWSAHDDPAPDPGAGPGSGPGKSPAADVPDLTTGPITIPGQGSPGGPSRVVEGTVTVRGGESLWSITADLLGPGASPADIAASWPHLWRVNGHQIPDPDLLRPGMILDLPEQLHEAGP